MDKAPKKPEDRAEDSASVELIQKAQTEGLCTCFSRYDTQENQCGFGKKGVCCKICHMGPCRITPKSPRGVCGADADTIVARNFLREVAGGTAAHSDHGRHLALRLKKVAEGKGAFGYDALKGEYTDMIKAGVIDPVKVVRGALENAASIAAMILTTDVLITDVPEKDKPAAQPPMPEY